MLVNDFTLEVVIEVSMKTQICGQGMIEMFVIIFNRSRLSSKFQLVHLFFV